MNNILIIVAVAIYVVSPIDLIPDFLPGGFLDDAALVGWLFNNLGSVFMKYAQEETNRKLLDGQVQ